VSDNVVDMFEWLQRDLLEKARACVAAGMSVDEVLDMVKAECEAIDNEAAAQAKADELDARDGL
jgi:hypothetical protein